MLLNVREWSCMKGPSGAVHGMIGFKMHICLRGSDQLVPELQSPGAHYLQYSKLQIHADDRSFSLCFQYFSCVLVAQTGKLY